MNDLFARVAARANEGGLPVTAEAVREIDRLLFEERLRSLPSIKGVAADANNAGEGGAGDADRQVEHEHTSPSSHSGEAAVNR